MQRPLADSGEKALPGRGKAKQSQRKNNSQQELHRPSHQPGWVGIRGGQREIDGDRISLQKKIDRSHCRSRQHSAQRRVESAQPGHMLRRGVVAQQEEGQQAEESGQGHIFPDLSVKAHPQRQ